MPSNLQSNLFWLLPVGAVLVGLLLVVRGLGTLVQNRRRRESWLRYPGRVVGSRLVSSSSDSADQTQCQVAYVRDGREVVFWNRYTATMLRSPEGREVEVLVNPEDATDAVISRGVAGGGLVGGSFAAAGAFFVVVGLAVGLHVLPR